MSTPLVIRPASLALALGAALLIPPAQPVAALPLAEVDLPPAEDLRLARELVGDWVVRFHASAAAQPIRFRRDGSACYLRPVAKDTRLAPVEPVPTLSWEISNSQLILEIRGRVRTTVCAFALQDLEMDRLELTFDETGSSRTMSRPFENRQPGNMVRLASR